MFRTCIIEENSRRSLLGYLDADVRTSFESRRRRRRKQASSSRWQMASRCDCQKMRTSTKARACESESALFEGGSAQSCAFALAKQAKGPRHLRRMEVLREALQSELLAEQGTFFFDVDHLHENLSLLSDGFKAAFPNQTAALLHTVAVKANPLMEVLKICNERGMGAEAASLGELELALQAGFPHKKIVYDSPTKTKSEIEYALLRGVLLNADNLQEIEVIRSLVVGDNNPYQLESISIGLRLNTQVGSGKIEALSTASLHSKFGVSIQNYRSEIIEAFLEHPWLDRIHVHTGSQGCSSDLLVDSILCAVELAREINNLAKSPLSHSKKKMKVKCIDIGGGLSVDYSRDQAGVRCGSVTNNPFQEYAQQLRERIPNFSEFEIITEFGRSVLAKCCFAASSVEYTKYAGDRRIVSQHLGADAFVRQCYLPKDFPVRVFSCDSFGNPLEVSEEVENWISTDVAGPLCFSGDLLARERLLPSKVSPGTYLIVPDVGAYTLSMFSRYNSRFFPSVWGFKSSAASSNHHSGLGFEFSLFRQSETLQDIVHFWSA